MERINAVKVKKPGLVLMVVQRAQGVYPPEEGRAVTITGIQTSILGQHATQFLALHEAQSSVPDDVQLLSSWNDQDTGVALEP